MADAITLGDHIESKCTRCHDVTGHIVVLMIENEITKVECRACGSIHKYYPPTTKKNDLRKTKNSNSGSKKVQKGIIQTTKDTSSITSKKSKSQKVSREIAKQWQKAIDKSYSTPKPYTMTVSLAVGDIIEHPRFGNGIVQEIFPSDKAEVLFREGIKLLKCSTN